MSNIIPPMLSSTPPPMEDDNLEDDDDDDFGDFSTGDLNYGLDITEPSKVSIDSWEKNSSPVPKSHEDDLKKTSLHNGAHLILDLRLSNQEVVKDPIATASQVLTQDNTSQDSFASVGTDSGLCSVSPNSVETSPVPDDDRLSPTTPSVNSREESCGSDETVIKSLSIDPDRTLANEPNSSILTNGDLQEEGIPEEFNDGELNQSDVSDFNHFERSVDNIITTSRGQSPKNSEIVPFPPERDSTELHPPLSQSDGIESNDLIQEECDTSAGSGRQESEAHYFDSYSELSEHLPDLIIDKDLLNEPRFEIDDINESDTDDIEPPVFVEQDVEVQNNTLGSAILKSDIPSSECDLEEFSAFETANVSSFTAEFPVENKEDEEDFSDFSSSAFTESTAATSFFPLGKSENDNWATLSKSEAPATADTFDDFDDDFDNFETASPVVDHHSQLNVNGVVTSLFPSPPAESSRADAEVASSEAVAAASPVWGNLRDVDTSNALSYQWVSSASNKLLLTSLGIDARNILFGPKWNVSVPRFAANLGVSPLEPVQARSPAPPAVLPAAPVSTQLIHAPSTSAKADAIVPDAKFDWTSSGLVNPLDCTQSALLDLNYLKAFDNVTLSTSDSNAAWRFASVEKAGQRAEAKEHAAFDNGQRILGCLGLGTEAAKVIDSLPDLSYLRSRTLVFPKLQQAQPQQ